MGVITKEVTVKWNNMNMDWFKLKGYEYTGYRDDVTVKVEDMPKGSGVKIETECDWCKKKIGTAISEYNDIIEKYHNYLCSSCRQKERHIIAKNVLYYTHPHIAKLLKNKDDAFQTSYGSYEKVCFICESCHNEYYAIPRNVDISKSNLCPYCGDGSSYNNKFMANVLQEANIPFQAEYFNKDWCYINHNGEQKRVRYDFLIEDLKLIIEMDGGWHTTDNPLSKQTAEESMIIDSLKDKLAIDNGYDIIRIDCDNRKYDFYHMGDVIKSQIIEKLSSYLDVSNVDWDDIDSKSRISDYKQVWNLINDGINSPSKLKEITGRSSAFIRTAINLGRKLEIITYQTQHEDVIEKTKKLKEYWDSGIYDLHELQTLVGTNETVSLRKYLKIIYQETNDIYYVITTDKYCYCEEDDTYYSMSYIAEQRKNEFPNKTLDEIYKTTYVSMYKSIRRKGSLLGKHWKILSRQEAYFLARKDNKTVLERS